MSAPAEPAAAPPRSARSLAARQGLLLLALLPGSLLTLSSAGSAGLERLALALALALLIELGVRALRRGRAVRLDGALPALPTALLVALLLPAQASLWAWPTAVGVALLLGLRAYGGYGQQLFQPAAIGIVAALWLFPAAAATAPPPEQALALALAWAAGGLLLIALRVLAWQVPLAVLLGALLLGLLEVGTGTAPWAHAFAPLTSSVLMVLAFFLASDPPSGCSTPRGRWVFGLGVGLLATGLPLDNGLLAALSGLLLMNAMAPLLDHALRRRPPAPAGSPRA